MEIKDIIVECLTKLIIMKKSLLFIATCCIAMGAMAQQWAGSTTTSDTIYRYGLTQIIPTQNNQPFLNLTNSSRSEERRVGKEC